MGLLRRSARAAVIGGAAQAGAGRVARKQQAAAQAQAAQQQAASPAAPEAPAAADPVAKVKELADLHAQGILTDEEFAAAKAKALGI